ncbi:uncharacterized protein BT62DRAFT_1000847 [Guyanagaster necrorhizus]|uniref:VWFA domain-containing protein n=1 Tax=Guyanagaster necrorhizus TaxID=856835 RepID=A0A9P7W1I0_9AGAR|nr:uncharacterized protein BT62DRAFT_1000847 [Guyanagaster necrorhizus MCA 3950]KAG7451591.1 hypothetical protein BT62DRAFT_1000847 [Guyanagaster necrorhizus MCA 3950]
MENEFQYLDQFDTVLIVDDSRSMVGRRWEIARKALGELTVVAAQYDSDGIEIHFLNDPTVRHGLTTKEEVNELFQSVTPTPGTPIGRKLDSLLTAYVNNFEELQREGKKLKKVNYILLTDGEPSEARNSELYPDKVIVKAAKRLDKLYAPQVQIGIQFVQIGHSVAATQFLQSLDGDLMKKYNIRDIVDTTHARAGHDLSAKDMIKILTGGINRSVDNQDMRRRT